MRKLIKFCIIVVIILLLVRIVTNTTEPVQFESDMVNSLMEKLADAEVNIDLQEMRKELEAALEENALYDIDASNLFDEKQEIREGSMDKTFVADNNIKKLDIELAGCMFELKASEDACYYLEYNGQGKIQIYVEDNELYLKALNGNDWNVNDDNGGMVLYVPEGVVFDQVEVDLGAGKMILNNLQALEVEVNLGAGQILAEKIQADQANLTVGAGEIVLKDALFTDMNAEIDVGNCQVYGSINGNIEADCAMGNIELQLEGTEQDFNYEIICVTGNITICEEKYSGLTTEKTIYNSADKNMKLDCAVGNISVEF